VQKLLFSFVAVLAVFALLNVPALAARAPAKAPTVNTLGNDISWPQCGKRLPTNQAFGIVGVNGGLATTTNPCLKDQLLWAAKSSGAANQPKSQLYVNTANPGGLNTPSWPQRNVDTAGNLTANPYGTCDGTDSLACAWQYGWNRAEEDIRLRFKPAAQAAGVSDNAANYRWWLDVETENTWKEGASGHPSNVADLEGMVAYFASQNVWVGIYSTGYQWGQIVGTAVQPNSNLNNRASWLAGAANEADAKNKCALPPLTAGGQVTLVLNKRSRHL
jgi:hypothetical protein